MPALFTPTLATEKRELQLFTANIRDPKLPQGLCAIGGGTAVQGGYLAGVLPAEIVQTSKK